MTPSVRTLQGSKTKGFQGSTPLCPRGSNARGFSNNLFRKKSQKSQSPKVPKSSNCFSEVGVSKSH